MLVVYASMTGNVKRFVDKMGLSESAQISGSFLCVNKPFVLITYTIGNGETPKEVEQFLQYDYNHRHLVGVVGSGNRNWGDNFCKGAKNIANKYNVPLLHTFELSGYDGDVEIVTTKIREIEGMKQVWQNGLN